MVNTDVKTEVMLQWVRPYFFEILCKYLPVNSSQQPAIYATFCFVRRQIDGGEIQEDLIVMLEL